jgi:hypothetical protein
MKPFAAQPYRAPVSLPEHSGRPFRSARSSIGAGSAGHWLRMAGILSPLVIGELVKDADQKWRWIRISAVATALVSEGIHAHRVSERREEQRRERCR